MLDTSNYQGLIAAARRAQRTAKDGKEISVSTRGQLQKHWELARWPTFPVQLRMKRPSPQSYVTVATHRSPPGTRNECAARSRRRTRSFPSITHKQSTRKLHHRRTLPQRPAAACQPRSPISSALFLLRLAAAFAAGSP